MTDLNRVKKLAGILNEDYQYDMSDKGDMHDALNDVQNTIDGAMQGLQKASNLASQVTDEIQKTLYTDESVEEMSDLDRIKQLSGVEERKVNFDPDDMYDQGKVRRNTLEALMDMFNTAKEYEGEVTDEQIEILGGLMQDMDNAGIEPEKYSELNELWKSVSAYGNVSGLSTVKKAYQQIKQMDPEDK